MYAIIETGGKQYRVQPGDVFNVEKLDAEVGSTIELENVLLLNNGELKVGAPYVEGAKVFAEVIEHGKGDKVIIFKYKAKKDYRKKQGHRQPYTMLKITSLDGVVAPVEKTETKINASMKKDELIALALEKGIEVDSKATKAVIIETIEAALK